MSDYTPTTEEVRRQFSESLIYEKEYREVFDRWLAEVEQKAWNRGYLNGYSKGQLDE